MARVLTEPFPFNELRRSTGAYYEFPDQLIRAGFENSQIWCVSKDKSDDGSVWWYYGPPIHYVNILGYVGTAEHHDGDTYYEECVEDAKKQNTWSKEA
jgi:hypothetical protein